MYEVKSRPRKIDGVEIEAWRCELEESSIMGVEVGTTGNMHDGHKKKALTLIRLENIFRTDMDARAVLDDNEDVKAIELILRGDAELANIIEALKFATKVLEEERRDLEDVELPDYLKKALEKGRKNPKDKELPDYLK